MGKFKGRTIDIQRLNAELTKVESRILGIIDHFHNSGQEYSVTDVSDRFLGVDRNSKTVHDMLDWVVEHKSERIGIDISQATVGRYKTVADHVKKFMIHKKYNKEYRLSQLEYVFISQFEHYLRTVARISNNTAMKHIQLFRAGITKAIENGWLERDPFKAFKSRTIIKEKPFLTSEDVNTLQTKRLTTPRLARVRDVFVFCCYTGLSFADVKKLKRGDVRKNDNASHWVIQPRTKTSTVSRIFMLPQAMALLEKYRDDPECIVNDTAMPVLSNQKHNAYLKELADICGIEVKMTSHTARHTCGTLLLNAGVPMETVQAHLGHKSMKQTQHYAKLLNKKIEEDMLKAAERLTQL